jgi:hypothetical protein
MKKLKLLVLRIRLFLKDSIDRPAVKYLDEHRWIVLLIIAEAFADCIHKPMTRLTTFLVIWISLSFARKILRH